jgi:hypothetical protein
LSEFFKIILCDEFKDFAQDYARKIDLIDENNVLVDPKLISTSIFKTGFVDLSGIKKNLILEYFTLEGYQMLETTVNLFLASLSCDICDKSCTSKNIICGKCKLFFHLKCVDRTYVPKIKKWFCQNCSN